MASPELPTLLCSLAALMAAASWHQGNRARLAALERQLNRGGSAGRPQTSGLVRSTLHRLVPRRALDADAGKLSRAGIRMPAEALWVYRAGASAAGAVIVPAAGFALGLDATGLLLAAGAVGGVLGIDWWLNNRIRHRHALLRRDWPGFLFRLRLSLLAGMPLPLALDAIAVLNQDRGSVLDGDLREAVRKIKAGMPCDSALNEWAATAGCGEVAVLAGAVERSRSTGVPLAATIEMHQRTARSRQRFAYLAWLNALPSRLSVVAMIFFMPAVLIIVLVPNVIAFLRAGW